MHLLAGAIRERGNDATQIKEWLYQMPEYDGALGKYHFDENGDEIKRYMDNFPINKDGLIEREILIEVPGDLIGIYNVYFALSSDLENSVMQSVVLGRTSTTGFSIFDINAQGRIIGYFVFAFIVGGIIAFTIWFNRKNTKQSKSKNKELLRKKSFFGFFKRA